MKHQAEASRAKKLRVFSYSAIFAGIVYKKALENFADAGQNMGLSLTSDAPGTAFWKTSLFTKRMNGACALFYLR